MKERRNERFGQMFRQERENAKVSMGAVARHLNISTPYLSDVELGRRAPLNAEHIIAAARLWQIDPMALLKVAIESREAVEIATPKTNAGREAMASLQRRADDFTDAEWEAIHDIANRRNS